MNETVSEGMDNRPLPNPDTASGTAKSLRRWIRLLDGIIFLVLLGLAWSVRAPFARGDLWLDESDYALAAMHGVPANRHDTPIAGDPEKILRLRHYHPPLVTYVMRASTVMGVKDRNLRLPFLLAGSLSVGLVYLCGLVLFAAPGGMKDEDTLQRALLVPQRPAALLCAIMVVFSATHIRASAHALPWAFITMLLLVMLWSMLMSLRTLRPKWLIAAWLGIGLMFSTSEYFFPSILALGLCAPVVLLELYKSGTYRKELAVTLVVGAALALGIAIALWPAGIMGGAWKMLQHYMKMANDPWPVKIRGVLYERAPKWAYLYWYWFNFKAFTLCTGAGALTVLVLSVLRKVNARGVVLLVMTGVILLTAHRSHIIGPEYLSHAIPFLSLLAGFFFYTLLQFNRPVGCAVCILVIGYFSIKHSAANMPGMDERVRVARWPYAIQYLASQWRPSDRMLAPAGGGGARWYLIYEGGIPAKDWQVQALPDGPTGSSRSSSMNRAKLLRDILQGVYRYVVVGTAFSDRKPMDPFIRQILNNKQAPWQLVWQSQEYGEGESRLIIYELPRGIWHGHPLPVPHDVKWLMESTLNDKM